MDANEIIDAALRYISYFSPLIFILAALSFADILINFIVSLLYKLPKYDSSGRRSR